jgi:hypothetical protein
VSVDIAQVHLGSCDLNFRYVGLQILRSVDLSQIGLAALHTLSFSPLDAPNYGGHPKPHLISTSHFERQNLTIPMQMRRFARLTNAFSKKLENLKAALSLHFAWYNFCRIHSTLRVTPAMAANLSYEVWPIDSLVA